MGDLVYLEDFSKREVRKFEVFYEYGNYSNPSFLLADFVEDKKFLQVGEFYSEYRIGNYSVLSGPSKFDNFSPVNFTYNDRMFLASFDASGNGGIVDLFFEYLSKKEIPWKLLEKKVAVA